MGRLGSGVRRGAVALLVVLLAACTALYQNHGYVPRDADLEQVVVGESTREDVAKAVGRPSSTGLLTGGAWYYVGSGFRHFGPREPREIRRPVVPIRLDQGGTGSK